MVENQENNGTEVIGLVPPTPGHWSRAHHGMAAVAAAADHLWTSDIWSHISLHTWEHPEIWLNVVGHFEWCHQHGFSHPKVNY